jgi:hypothetical protein
VRLVCTNAKMRKMETKGVDSNGGENFAKEVKG